MYSYLVVHLLYNNNHKARFRAHSRLSFEGRNKDDLLYRHFFGPGHHGLEDVSIQLIDRVSGEESALRDKEGQWAYRLNCYSLRA